MILSDSTFSVTPTHAHPLPTDRLVCFRDDDILMDEQGASPTLPTLEQAGSLLAQSPFELAHTAAFTLWCPHPMQDNAVPEGNTLRYCPIGVFRTLPHEMASLIVACRHLWTWYRANRFCGCCGKPLAPHTDERALACAACGHLRFPTIVPAVIVAITSGDSLLLARNARSTFRHHTLISGYVEVGETLEHAVHREVMEEVGLTLKNLRYLGDQPWGISGSHMFAFHAEAERMGPIVLQKSELSEARWFARSELQPQPNTVSVAFELIERFRTGRL